MRPAQRIVLASGFLVSLAVRVAFLVSFRGNYDVASYAEVAAIVRHGGDLYAGTTRYNYAPAWAFLMAGAAQAAGASGVPFAAVVGALLLACDAATAWVLYRLGGRGRRGAAAALLFFANPVSVIATGHYLQFDNVAILFLLLALLAARDLPRGRLGVVAALSASIVIKHVTAFMPLAFERGSPRGDRRGLGGLGALLPYAVFAASFAPFWRSWPAIRRHVAGYSGGREDYGVGLLRAWPAMPSWAPAAIFLAGVALALWAGRRLELSRACLLLFLVMLLLTPGVNEYYFVWPIALGALSGGAGFLVYTLVVAGFFIGGALEGLRVPLAHAPGWGGVWWSVALWLAWDARQRQRSILSSE